MSLALFGLISILSMTLFGVIAIVLSLREEKGRKIIALREAEERERLSEMGIITEIQEQIGSANDIEKAIDIIVGSLDTFIQYSTASGLIIRDQNLFFKTYLHEGVSHIFIDQVRQSMVEELSKSSTNVLPLNVEQTRTGGAIDENNPRPVASLSTFPLIINNKTVALIGVATTKPNVYDEEAKAKLARVIKLASQALSRLDTILTIEKGKLMAMIGSLSDGVFMVDGNNQLFIINKAAKVFLTIQKEDPNIIDVLSAMPNTYNFGDRMQKVITQNTSVEEKEVVIGSKIFKVFINPVLDRSQNKTKVIGASFLLHDITLEKSLEQMKEDFTNVIVHELRSPLTAIKASAELLLHQKNLSEEQKDKFTNMIAQQSDSVLDEVSLILDSAKLQAGLFTVQKASGNLKDIIDSKIAVFSPLAQNKFIKLVAECDPTMKPFAFDTHRIGQALNNLLSNSMKFTPSGGTITVRTKMNADSVTVSVSDTGAGIPKDQQHLLFSRFSQVASEKSHKGSGLGLYFIKGVVEAHGGNVMLDSDEGKGTTISFTLPLTPIDQKQESGHVPFQRMVN